MKVPVVPNSRHFCHAVYLLLLPPVMESAFQAICFATVQKWSVSGKLELRNALLLEVRTCQRKTSARIGRMLVPRPSTSPFCAAESLSLNLSAFVCSAKPYRRGFIHRRFLPSCQFEKQPFAGISVLAYAHRRIGTSPVRFSSYWIRERRRGIVTNATDGAEALTEMSPPTDEAVQKILRKGREIGAFVTHSDCVVMGAAEGPLLGLTFAVKDMFHVAGHPTGFGNPTWLETHPIPTTTAPCVQVLLDAGATLVGKTVMDELAFSLAGENHHLGTPLNSAAPSRIPGGSSSGSASAVAAGLVDFALGSDTAGSVRVPASYNGILGIRTSQGRISMEGVLPLQPSLDTVGWFARDPLVFKKVGDVLFADPRTSTPQTSTRDSDQRKIATWLVAGDAFEQLTEGGGKGVKGEVGGKGHKGEEGEGEGWGEGEGGTAFEIFKAIAPVREELSKLIGPPIKVAAGELEGMWGYEGWKNQIWPVQLEETWESDGVWIKEHQPEFGPGVKERFEAASNVNREAATAGRVAREKITAHMRGMLQHGAVLTVPSAPGPAPLKGTNPATTDVTRQKLLCLTHIGGPPGLPQVSIPVATVDGCPVGMGLIGPFGWDEELLALTVKVMTLVEESKV